MIDLTRKLAVINVVDDKTNNISKKTNRSIKPNMASFTQLDNKIFKRSSNTFGHLADNMRTYQPIKVIKTTQLVIRINVVSL